MRATDIDMRLPVLILDEHKREPSPSPRLAGDEPHIAQSPGHKFHRDEFIHKLTPRAARAITTNTKDH